MNEPLLGKRPKTMKVNTRYLPLKIHFFFFFAGTAPVLPFLPLYAREIGISTAGIGLMYAVLPFVGLFSKMVSGAIADYFQIHRKVFIGSLIICTFGFFSIYLTPSVPQFPNPIHAEIELHCGIANSYLVHCGEEKCGDQNLFEEIIKNVTSICSVNCDLAPGDEAICGQWHVSDSACRGGNFKFNSSTNLIHADKLEKCSYIPIVNASVAEYEVDHPHCKDEIVLNCTTVCDSDVLSEYLGAPLTVPPSSYEELLSLWQFWIYLLCSVVAWVGLSVVVVMSDTVCFQILGSEGHKYGQQRLFGSLGWGLLVIITGGMIDYFSYGAKEDYTPAFILSAAILLIDIFPAIKLEVTGAEKQRANAKAVVSLMTDPRVALFFLCCIVVGTATGILWTFQLLLVEDTAYAWDCNFGAIKLLEGLLMGIQCFGGEIPFFFLSGYFLKKFGHFNNINIVIFVFSVRFLIYSMIVDPWFFLPVELLNGFTFGLFYATMTSYASYVAPPGMEATLQGLLGASFEGVGIALGGFIGGTLYFRYGGPALFWWAGWANLVFLLLNVLAQFLLSRLYTSSSPVAESSRGYTVAAQDPITASGAEENFNAALM